MFKKKNKHKILIIFFVLYVMLSFSNSGLTINTETSLSSIEVFMSFDIKQIISIHRLVVGAGKNILDRKKYLSLYLVPNYDLIVNTAVNY